MNVQEPQKQKNRDLSPPGGLRSHRRFSMSHMTISSFEDERVEPKFDVRYRRSSEPRRERKNSRIPLCDSDANALPPPPPHQTVMQRIKNNFVNFEFLQQEERESVVHRREKWANRSRAFSFNERHSRRDFSEGGKQCSPFLSLPSSRLTDLSPQLSHFVEDVFEQGAQWLQRESDEHVPAGHDTEANKEGITPPLLKRIVSAPPQQQQFPPQSYKTQDDSSASSATLNPESLLWSADDLHFSATGSIRKIHMQGNQPHRRKRGEERRGDDLWRRRSSGQMYLKAVEDFKKLRDAKEWEENKGGNQATSSCRTIDDANEMLWSDSSIEAMSLIEQKSTAPKAA